MMTHCPASCLRHWTGNTSTVIDRGRWQGSLSLEYEEYSSDPIFGPPRCPLYQRQETHNRDTRPLPPPAYFPQMPPSHLCPPLQQQQGNTCFVLRSPADTLDGSEPQLTAFYLVPPPPPPSYPVYSETTLRTAN